MEQNELISGSGGKGKHPHTPVESNDTLKSKQTIKLLFAVAEGEITSIDDILLDKVSISHYTASYAWRSGLSNQTVIPGFIDTESPLSPFTSVQLIKATSFTYNIDSLVDAVRLTISLDNLRQIQENGDMTGYSVSVDVYTKATTSSSQILYTTTTKKGKASNTYTWDIIVDRPTNYVPGTNWSVVVNRASADDANVKYNSVTRLVAITQIYHKQLTYPGTALVALTLKDAGEFGGQVPQILIKGKGRKVLVPSNYNPTTRVYTGTWDLSMSSVKQFTDNIAWVLYDVLHDSTCLGIDTADIDKTSFYLLSVYADTLIPDGYGNNIPRYSIGNQFYARDNVPTFIQNLLSLCNGMLTENEFGQIKIIFDQPNLSASRLVTNANVVGGLFNYSSNDLENRYSLVNVTYNNYLSYNETDTATWSDDALITRYGLQTSDIVLPGCIYEAQAIRKARWAVYTNAITTKLLTFNVMFEGLSFRNGSIIKVMDSDNAGVSQHGIVKSTSFSGANTTIVMDRSITLAAQTYTVTFYTTDGVTLYTKTLLQTNSTVSSISFVGTEVPLVGSTFILSGTVVPQLFRVVGNSKNNDDTYTISCLVYDTAKFTYIDQGITLPGGTGDFINIGGFTSPAVTNLAVSPISSTNGVNSNIQLNVHWDWNLTNTEKYAATFQATWVRDNNDIIEIKDITGNSFDINGAIPGTYDITVWVINPFSGIKSTPATLSYAYRTTAGNSTLLPPINARVTGTLGLIYSTPALTLLFDYNTLNDSVSDGLLDYVVELWTLTGTTKVGTYVVKPDTAFNGTFNFPFLENLAIFGTSTRSYIIKLYSRDLTGFVSTAYAVTVNNTVPAIQSFIIVSGVSSVFIKVTTTPEIDVTGYVVHRSLTSGFTPAVGTLVYQGPDTYITLNVPDTQTYYYKIAAYDSFGTTGLTYSSEQSNTALSMDAITWSKTGIVFGVGTTNQLTWTAGTIIKAGTTTYTIVAGNATWTTGTLYAYFNPAVSTTVIQTTTTLGTAVGVGCYPIATYTGGAVTNIKGGTGEAFISGSQIIAGTVGASQLITGTAVITGTAQIGSAVIQDVLTSSTFSSTTPKAGWRLDKNGDITSYGTLNLLDSSGNVVLSSGNNPSFNYDYIGGSNKPDNKATRNVFTGNWKGTTTPVTTYSVGDIVLDSVGYGWSCVLAHNSVTATTAPPTYPNVSNTTSNTYWTLYAVKGVDAVSVILSNDTHTLPATSDGTVGSYVGSGTTVQVFDGTREVIYDAVGTSNGTWKVVATPSKTATLDDITVGTLTDSGNYLTVGVASGFVTSKDTAFINYAITGKAFNGDAISITAQQSFSKSKAGTNGVNGSNGDSVDIVFVRSATVPATPTASTGVPTAPITWYTSVTTANTAGGIVNPLYSSTGLKTASVGNYTWDTPVRIDGTAVAEVTVFVRSATAPATPTTGGTYTFSATPVVVAPTAPIAWSTSVPIGTNPVYTSRAVVSTSSNNTAAVTISGWSTPVISLQNGADGADGAQGPTVQITTNRAATFVSNDDVLASSQTNLVFTATTSGITATSYVWTFYADSSTTAITSATMGVTLGGTPTGKTCTLTQTQFGSALAGIKSLKVVCVVNGDANYIDHITVVRLDNSTAAPGATVGANFYNTYQLLNLTTYPAITTTSGLYATTYTAGTGNLTSGVGSLTITACASNILTTAAHGLTAGTSIIYNCTATPITGLTNGTTYYVTAVTATTFKLSSTSANAILAVPVVLTLGALTAGTHTIGAIGSNWLFGGYSTAIGGASGAKLTFTRSTLTGSYMIGLNVGTSTSAHYSDIDYAIYLAGGDYYIRESGTDRGRFGTCVAGDRFAVLYDGGAIVSYYINGTNFYSTVLGTTITGNIIVDASISSANTTINGIGFGAYTVPTLLTSNNLVGQIHPGNVSTYIANAAIAAAQIGSINLVGNFNVASATTGERMTMDSQAIKVYDAANILRVKIGNLA